MIQGLNASDEEKSDTKFSRWLAKWQEISDAFETHVIDWGTIQLHCHIVKVCRLLLLLTGRSNQIQKIMKILLLISIRAALYEIHSWHQL